MTITASNTITLAMTPLVTEGQESGVGRWHTLPLATLSFYEYLQIKKIARENGVHIVQNAPLARSLYDQVELDKPIPHDLFAAVAEVLAYVYKMSRK